MLCAVRWLEDKLISQILLRLREESLVVGKTRADMGKWKRDQGSVKLLAAVIKENRNMTQFVQNRNMTRFFVARNSAQKIRCVADLKRGAG